MVLSTSCRHNVPVHKVLSTKLHHVSVHTVIRNQVYMVLVLMS